MKRTKIVATIGPASESYSNLLKMAQAGMDVCRLNFSHNTHQSHLNLIKNIRKVEKTIKKPIAIIQDLQGPRIRVGKIQDMGIKIKKNEKLILISEKYFRSVKSDLKVVPVTFDLHQSLKKGSQVLIQEGLIELKVLKISDKKVYVQVVIPGTIFSSKGINVPDIIMSSVLTEKDKNDLKFGLKHNVDFVALSFVESEKDILGLKRFIRQHKKNSTIKIISKIERQNAINNIDKIIAVSDAIMIARGDLGIEVGVEKVPVLQKTIINKCLQFNKPVIVATHMLESMIDNRVPTRAEVSDVANAIIDHTDAVMLSGESAFGKYPLETVKIMNKIIKNTEESSYDDLITLGSDSLEKEVSKVVDLFFKNNVKAVVIGGAFDNLAKIISSFRPEIPIIVFDNEGYYRRYLSLIWGVYSWELKKYKDFNVFIQKSLNILSKEKVIKKGEKILFVSRSFNKGKNLDFNLYSY